MNYFSQKVEVLPELLIQAAGEIQKYLEDNPKEEVNIKVIAAAMKNGFDFLGSVFTLLDQKFAGIIDANTFRAEVAKLEEIAIQKDELLANMIADQHVDQAMEAEFEYAKETGDADEALAMMDELNNE